MSWTEKHIKGLLKNNRIKGYSADVKKDNTPTPARGNKSKALIWLDWNLTYWCNERSLTLHCSSNGGELQFHPERKFRFDYAIPALKIAVEYEGGIFMKTSGHNTARHYTKDTEKYNLATTMGWRIIRVTALNYPTVLKTLNEMIGNR